MMHVWRPSAGDGGSDFLAALDRLTPIAESFDVTPIDLFGHLAGLAESWGPVAGVVDADSVLRQLRRRGLGAAGPSGSALAGTSNTIDIDAVVRGPIDSLGLQGEVAEAERLLAAGDAQAASKFASIVTRLEAARFLPHATIMRRRQADALQAIGRDDDAMIMRIGMAWEGLDADRPWDAGFALHDGRRPGVHESLQEATERARTAADMAVQVAKGDDLDRSVTAFDRLADNDPYLVRAAVFLCEEAIADAQPGLLLDRMDLLEAIATEASHTGDDRRADVPRASRCASPTPAGSGSTFFERFIAATLGPSWPGCTPGTLGTSPCRATGLAPRNITWRPSSVPARRKCSTRQPTGYTPGARCWPGMTIL